MDPCPDRATALDPRDCLGGQLPWETKHTWGGGLRPCPLSWVDFCGLERFFFLFVCFGLVGLVWFGLVLAGFWGLPSTQWVKCGMFWELFALNQAGSPTGSSGPTWLISGRRETEACGRYRVWRGFGLARSPNTVPRAWSRVVGVASPAPAPPAVRSLPAELVLQGVLGPKWTQASPVLAPSGLAAGP